MNSPDLLPHIADIARRILGEHNPRLSTRHQMRFGNNGSIAVEIAGPKRGSWWDHENGVGGGPLDLIQQKGGIANGAVAGWLKANLGIEPGREEGGGGFKILATYDYRDEGGALLFQVCRLYPKDFRQRRLDGHGKWVWETKSARKVLYRLPELIVAPTDKWVFVVEGEKDVDNMLKLGLVATTNPGGAAKPSPNGRPTKPKWSPQYATRDAKERILCWNSVGRLSVPNFRKNLVSSNDRDRAAHTRTLPRGCRTS